MLVTGTNFVNSANLRCRFDYLIVNATFLSASTLRCVSPQHVMMSVPVEVSNNDQDYTTTGILFRYIGTRSLCSALFALSRGCFTRVLTCLLEQWVVTSIYPPNGPLSGATVVTVSGRFFESGNIACKFGSLPSVLASVYVSATQIRCVAPAHANGSVFLEVSNNNDDFTDNRVDFFYQCASRRPPVCLYMLTSLLL